MRWDDLSQNSCGSASQHMLCNSLPPCITVPPATSLPCQRSLRSSIHPRAQHPPGPVTRQDPSESEEPRASGNCIARWWLYNHRMQTLGTGTRLPAGQSVAVRSCMLPKARRLLKSKLPHLDTSMVSKTATVKSNLFDVLGFAQFCQLFANSLSSRLAFQVHSGMSSEKKRRGCMAASKSNEQGRMKGFCFTELHAFH